MGAALALVLAEPLLTRTLDIFLLECEFDLLLHLSLLLAQLGELRADLLVDRRVDLALARGAGSRRVSRLDVLEVVQQIAGDLLACTHVELLGHNVVRALFRLGCTGAHGQVWASRARGYLFHVTTTVPYRTCRSCGRGCALSRMQPPAGAGAAGYQQSCQPACFAG